MTRFSTALITLLVLPVAALFAQLPERTIGPGLNAGRTPYYQRSTLCPDVCPTSMQEMAEVKKMLGADGERLQSIFITVDPERDTPEMLKAYMANFDPSFLALVGNAEQTAALAKEFKIYYKKAEGKTPTSYTMDHSAGSYIYDTQGRLRVYYRYGSGAEALAHDVKQLLKEAR